MCLQHLREHTVTTQNIFGSNWLLKLQRVIPFPMLARHSTRLQQAQLVSFMPR